MSLTLSSELLDELAFLALFPLDTLDQGLKVHNNADASSIAAAGRLFEKGMVSQRDGGYLTERGREVAEHWARVQQLMTAPVFEAASPML